MDVILKNSVIKILHNGQRTKQLSLLYWHGENSITQVRGTPVKYFVSVHVVFVSQKYVLLFLVVCYVDCCIQNEVAVYS